MGQLAQATQGQQLQAAPAPTHTIQDIIKSQWSKIEAVMPKHMSSERLYQITISAINHEPKLMQCDVTTLLSCVMKCSALGLEPSSVDGLGRAYILPFNNKKARKMEATFILGYKGMIELARRSGQIKDLSARAVYDGDFLSTNLVSMKTLYTVQAARSVKQLKSQRMSTWLPTLLTVATTLMS